MWQLIRDAGALDLNSSYCYLMVTHYFSETCILAQLDEDIAGFISAFVVPNRPDTLFVWQVAVAKQAREQGIASDMLLQLLQRPACSGITRIETTVTPDNQASQTMFRRLAGTLSTTVQIRTGFAPSLFPDARHDAERLFCIGPFDVNHPPSPSRGDGDR